MTRIYEATYAGELAAEKYNDLFEELTALERAIAAERGEHFILLVDGGEDIQAAIESGHTGVAFWEAAISSAKSNAKIRAAKIGIDINARLGRVIC